MFIWENMKCCEICWRVLIYPRNLDEKPSAFLVDSGGVKPFHGDTSEWVNISKVAKGLQKDPTPHPWRYQKA